MEDVPWKYGIEQFTQAVGYGSIYICSLILSDMHGQCGMVGYT